MAKAKAKAKTKTVAAATVVPEAAPYTPERPKSPAEWMHDRLVKYIRDFESQLDARHEIALGLAAHEAGVLRIEGMGFFDPDIVTFYGHDDNGAQTQLIQHFTQLSVTLRAVPKEVPSQPPRRIGFHLQAGWIGGDAGDGSVG